jgi:hypothetical protein
MMRRLAFESGVVFALTSALLFLAATAGIPGRPEAPQAAASETVGPADPIRNLRSSALKSPLSSWHELTSPPSAPPAHCLSPQPGLGLTGRRANAP